MSSASSKNGPTQSKTGPASVSLGTPSNQAILLQKLNRQSTPDSEALVSSDDETEPPRQENPPPVSKQKPVRRASWLMDTSQPVPRSRKESFASSTMSPTTSHPTTPSTEPVTSAWTSHNTAGMLGRSFNGSASFSWVTGIWNSDRKEAPARLAEVLPSPTSTMPPAGPGSSFLSQDPEQAQSSPALRDSSNSTIPFAIPLHPTPKTYRSQSYSVGQLEPDSATTNAGGSSTVLASRGRPISISGLQHRPSRPSMLSEMSHDGSMLGKVNEDDDDNSSGSLLGGQHQSAEAKTIEILTRENALLRQQSMNSRLRSRPPVSNTFVTGNGYLQEMVPEECDYAVDELDEANDLTDRGLGRRIGEFGAAPFRSSYMVENRNLENVKKAIWQSSPGFGGLADSSQSRRHSFADVPTRQGSMGSIADAVAALEANGHDVAATHDELPSAHIDSTNFSLGAGTMFWPSTASPSAMPQFMSPAAYAAQCGSPYVAHQTSFSNRPPSPHRNVYGIPHARYPLALYIVLFKCARADVFYIQEETGLTVKPGDLVIVEADRGTDLGTVARDNVDWQTARDLKEHYAEEHYKWLMMYSQNAAAAKDGVGAGLMAASNGASAIGGMGPAGQHHMQEPNSGELKPKLIKRLAQAHEIHSLRDKEGNEAKAKRVCMQKVREHCLSMEILDAEFQMDWKKLTFYYFADSYINFNSLVTDLFKIYKTRIWMSAINPASFASPTLGLQAPSGIGPGAVQINPGSSTTERRQDQQEQRLPFGGSGQTGRNFQAAFSHPFSADRSAAPSLSYLYNPYATFGTGPRPGPLPFASATDQEAFSAPFTPVGHFSCRGRFSNPQFSSAQAYQGISSLINQADWMGPSKRCP